MLARLVFLLTFSASTPASARSLEPLPAAPAANPGASSPGQAVYQKVEPMVFKVKTAISADSPKASYGTGFAVAAEGLLITNYHVVSDAVLQPRQNKIFVVMGQESVPARILGIDVLRDLALLKVDRDVPKYLKFAPGAPRQGSPIYSIGEPEDLNMAIVVGTYNGELTYGAYAMIHMSSPINSGMSGGPTVDSRAEIVGVNVSKNSFSDSLSFAVPARFARELLERARGRQAPDADKLVEEMGQQLADVQEDLTKDFLAAGTKTQPFGAWTMSQASPILKCWSQKEEDEDDGKYESIRQSCQLPHSSYISARLHSGTYSIELDAIDGRQLKALPFYTLLNSRFGNASQLDGFSFFGESGPQLLTRQFCFSRIAANKAGLKFKIAYCSRGYVKFKDLRDASVSVASLTPPPHGLLLQMDLRGFTSGNIKKILDTTLNSIGTGK